MELILILLMPPHLCSVQRNNTTVIYIFNYRKITIEGGFNQSMGLVSIFSSRYSSQKPPFGVAFFIVNGSSF